MNLKNLKFFIIPANMPPQFTFKNLHNCAYLHFKNSWERLLNRPNREKLFNPDEFLRQDYIFQVMEGNVVVCQLLGTHQDLEYELTQDLSYFQNFREDAQKVIKEEKKHALMSLEYSSTSRNYSPRFVNHLNFGEVIKYLGIYFARSVGAEVILGQPRRLTGSNDRVMSSGFRKVKENLTKCNVTVDITLGFIDEITECPDEITRSLIDKLWQERSDLMGFTVGTPERYGNYFGQKTIDHQKRNSMIPQQFKEEI